MYIKKKANFNLLKAYVAKMIGYSTIDFFERKSSNVNIFSTREDGTVKKKCLQEGAFGKKNDCRGALVKKKKLFAEENF